LIKLALLLAKLWVLPYKGLEVAWSVSLNEASPYLLLLFGMLPLLVFVMELLLPGKDFKGLDLGILVIELVRPSPPIPESYHVSIYSIIS
jgi:hypothetical protein